MALTDGQKRQLAMAQMDASAGAPVAPTAPGDISSGTASIAGAGIGAGAGLMGQLMAQAAARAQEKKALQFQGEQSSLRNQVDASQNLTERQQQAMARLMNNFKSALVR